MGEKSEYQQMIENCREGLYVVDIGHTNVVCNKYGYVVFHGAKKKVDEYLFNHKNQLELDFWEENNVCGKSR